MYYLLANLSIIIGLFFALIHTNVMLHDPLMINPQNNHTELTLSKNLITISGIISEQSKNLTKTFDTQQNEVTPF